MKELYETCEAVLMWGIVIFTIGLVVFLAYRKYRRMKHHRRYRQHRAHRAMRQSGGSTGEHQPSHHH